MSQKISSDLMSQIDRATDLLFDTKTQLEDKEAVSISLIQQVLTSSNIQVFKHPGSARTIQVAIWYSYLQQTNLAQSIFQHSFGDLSNIMIDEYGSYVLETLFKIISFESRKTSTLSNLYADFLNKLDFATLIQNKSAVRVLRVILFSEAGQQPQNVSTHDLCDLFEKQQKQSSFFQELMKAIFEILSQIGFKNAAEYPDVANLLMAYIQLFPAVWTKDPTMKDYHYITIFLQIFDYSESDKLKLLHFIDVEKEKRSHFFDDKELDHISLITSTYFDTKLASTAQFVIETLIAKSQILSCCYLHFILGQPISYIVNSQFQVRNALPFSFHSPNVLISFVELVMKDLDILFEMEQQYILQSVIHPIIQSYEKAQQYSSIELQQKILITLVQYVQKLQESTGNEEFLKKLLFPDQAVNSLVKLESHLTRYSFSHLKSEDRVGMTDQQFLKYQLKQKQEHQKVQEMHMAKKFGKHNQIPENGKSSQLSKIWGGGKSIVIELLKINIGQALVPIVMAFERSFINQPNQLVEFVHSFAGNDIIIEFLKNDQIPVFFKLKMANNLRSSFGSFATTKTGRLFTLQLFNAISTQLQLDDEPFNLKAIPKAINLDAMYLIGYELIEKNDTLNLLQKFPEGRDIVEAMKLSLLRDRKMKTKWENVVMKRLSQIETQNAKKQQVLQQMKKQ